MKKQVGKVFVMMMAALVLSVTVFEHSAEARAGGRRSFGGGSSQGFSRPAAAPRPQQQDRQQAQPAPPVNPQPAGGGFGRGLAGGIMGGLLGGLLFSSFAGANGGLGGLGGSGFGLIEILLAAGAGYMLIRFMRNRRAVPAGADARMGAAPFPAAGSPQGFGALPSELETGLERIRRMDPGFDEGRFSDGAAESFFRIQAAWMNRDLAPVSELLTGEMARIFQSDIDRMLRDGQINRLENPVVRKVEIVEANQELGEDRITVSIQAGLLDYTVDAVTGAVLEGSKTEPSRFQEDWTFTRPLGQGPWKLAGIRQA